MNSFAAGRVSGHLGPMVHIIRRTARLGLCQLLAQVGARHTETVLRYRPLHATQAHGRLRDAFRQRAGAGHSADGAGQERANLNVGCRHAAGSARWRGADLLRRSQCRPSSCRLASRHSFVQPAEAGAIAGLLLGYGLVGLMFLAREMPSPSKLDQPPLKVLPSGFLTLICLLTVGPCHVPIQHTVVPVGGFGIARKRGLVVLAP